MDMRSWNCDIVPVSVEATDDYHLFICYNNGERVVFDASYLLKKPVFQPLRDIEVFKSVRIDFDTVAWGSSLDIAPETLYERSVAV